MVCPSRTAVSRMRSFSSRGQLFAQLGILKPRQKLYHLPVHQDVALPEGLLQDDALQAGAAGQGHVHLPVGKGAPAHIDDRLFEGLSLALVDGDGKGQPHRILGEGADSLRGEFALLQEKPVDLPGVRGDFHRFPVVQFGQDDILALLRPFRSPSPGRWSR